MALQGRLYAPRCVQRRFGSPCKMVPLLVIQISRVVLWSPLRCLCRVRLWSGRSRATRSKACSRPSTFFMPSAPLAYWTLPIQSFDQIVRLDHLGVNRRSCGSLSSVAWSQKSASSSCSTRRAATRL